MSTLGQPMPVTGGERCPRAHVGFLVQGRMMVEDTVHVLGLAAGPRHDA